MKARNVSPGGECESLTAIIIPSGNSRPFKLSTLYNHPGNHFPQQFFSDVNSLTFNVKFLPTIILGDMNCPHQSFGSRTTNEFGSRLLQNIKQ